MSTAAVLTSICRMKESKEYQYPENHFILKIKIQTMSGKQLNQIQLCAFARNNRIIHLKIKM